jgi:hypothetical protein
MQLAEIYQRRGQVVGVEAAPAIVGFGKRKLTLAD